MTSRKNSKTEYTVVDLDGKEVNLSLEDNLKVKCSTVSAVSHVTGISRYKLRRLFVDKGRSYLEIGGYMIIKTSMRYGGSQPGGLRNTVNNVLLRGKK